MNKVLFTFLLIALISCKTELNSSNTIMASNTEELHTTIKNAQPGDEIILSNGTWKDTQIKFHATGTEDQPITLRAETPGKVTLEGESVLKISGEHLIENILL